MKKVELLVSQDLYTQLGFYPKMTLLRSETGIIKFVPIPEEQSSNSLDSCGTHSDKGKFESSLENDVKVSSIPSSLTTAKEFYSKIAFSPKICSVKGSMTKTRFGRRRNFGPGYFKSNAANSQGRVCFVSTSAQKVPSMDSDPPGICPNTSITSPALTKTKFVEKSDKTSRHSSEGKEINECVDEEDLVSKSGHSGFSVDADLTKIKPKVLPYSVNKKQSHQKSPKKFICETCKLIFRSKQGLKKHELKCIIVKKTSVVKTGWTLTTLTASGTTDTPAYFFVKKS